MYRIRTAAQSLEMLKDQQHELIKVTTENQLHRIADATNAVYFWQGVANILAEWEENVATISERAVERHWDRTRILVVQQQRLADLLLRSTDDSWSGRGNDARRSYADGRREALEQIAQDLKSDADAIFAAKSV